MRKYIILAQSQLTAASLDIWRSMAVSFHDDFTCPPAIVCTTVDGNHEGVADTFRTVVAKLESLTPSPCGDSAACHVTVLVDTVNGGMSPIDASPMSLTGELSDWDTLVAMLVQTFPEMQWVFGVVTGLDSTENGHEAEFKESLHSLDSLPIQWRYPQFDPTGLRHWIRLLTNKDLQNVAGKKPQKAEPFQLPTREKTAAVIEDEEDFAWLHGYATYRFGFRTDIVTSWEQMKERFHFHVQSPKAPAGVGVTSAVLDWNKQHRYQLILEDMRLQFPDKPGKTHLSKPDDRARQCNRLADENDRSDFRFMISTGQESATDDLWGLNEGHLYNKTYGIGKLLPKPIGGPLELWKTTGLNTLLENGLAEGFVSPPSEFSDEQYHGHGAPGKLALVARTLIDRARRVAANADTPEGFLLSAVLANDAFELLGGKTPTMSLEAIKLKHVAEIRAECAFVGVGFHVELDDRFREIDLYVKSVCRWYQPNQQKWCEWDAKATIYNEFVKIYRDAGQLEEQDKCLAQLRQMNRKLARPQGWQFVNPFAWAVHGVLAYAEMLLSDFWRVAFAFGCWIAALTLLSTYLTGHEANIFVYLAKQLGWMVGGGTHDVDISQGDPATNDLTFVIISILSNIIGVFHFGVLMSYFYGLVSRK